MSTLPAVPAGEHRRYVALQDHGDAKPYGLVSVHTTSKGTLVERWVPKMGWVDAPFEVDHISHGETGSHEVTPAEAEKIAGKVFALSTDDLAMLTGGKVNVIQPA